MMVECLKRLLSLNYVCLERKLKDTLINKIFKSLHGGGIVQPLVEMYFDLSNKYHAIMFYVKLHKKLLLIE